MGSLGGENLNHKGTKDTKELKEQEGVSPRL